MVYSILKPRLGEVEFYNSLPEVDVNLFPEHDLTELEEEPEPHKEADKLAEKANAASIFFDDVSRASVAQDEGTA